MRLPPRPEGDTPSRLSVPVSAPRRVFPTCAQVSVLSLSFALTSASNLSRSWGVRSQMPPVRSKLCVRDPSTLWPVCAASRAWSRIASVPLASTIVAPGGSDRLSAAIAMPSPSVSPDCTVYSNTSRFVPEPRT